MSVIKVATCQHPLSADIATNMAYIIRQIKTATSAGADIVHFPECNITGYAGVEFTQYEIRNNQQVDEALSIVKAKARKYKIFIVIGCHWFISEEENPYNSLFVIDREGELVGRYDKRLLTSGDSGDDVDYYSAGNMGFTFILDGVKCGLLICHEWRYPELYREYKAQGVDIVFQSWYDAGLEASEFKKIGIDHGSLIIGSIRSNAANNSLWISASNASNPESSFSSFLSQPDGRIVNKLARNRPGVLINTVDFSKKFIDPSKHNRERFFLDK